MAFDLIVIGAGINGAGVARDAALRGLKVCLVEQADLCHSTTRWSSRLIHGGLRYLEFGELGLVHESLQERETLLTIANHLVRPLPLLIPAYEHSRRGVNTVDFGLWVYDLLSIGRSVPGHQRLSRSEALARMPALNGEGLTGGVVYYDAQVTFVERLVVENVLAAEAAGAEIRTYTTVERIEKEGNHVRGVTVRDSLTGEGGTLEAPAIVNAAGPWVDRVLAGADASLPRFLGPTKGTHIVVPRFPGITELACYAEARADGRPFFIIPWNGQVLIGTTDTRCDEDPDRLRPTEAEIAYLLDATTGLLPGAGLTQHSIRYAYSGVRPLPRQGLKETSAITRRHQVRHHGRTARGLYSLIGGKITTYRHLAEEVVDQVAARLPQAVAPCSTAGQKLPGAGPRDAVLRSLGEYSAVPAAAHGHLYDVYGARAPEVAALTRGAPDLGTLLDKTSGAIAAEVVFAATRERARTLGDILLRRCMAGLGPDLGVAALPGALATAARHLGWDPARCVAEEAAYRAEIATLHPA
jgi:glycerol-3-phosphate dehydrogenase